MELLFKAKRKDNGEWLESDSILQFIKHPVSKIAEASLWVEGTGWVEIDPKTVGQFTGLYDDTSWEELNTDEQALFLYPESGDKRSKEDWKGKPVFEGDFVESFSCDYAGRPKIDTIIVGDMTDFNTVVYLNCCNKLKIIGNIHDNPKLLEVKK